MNTLRYVTAFAHGVFDARDNKDQQLCVALSIGSELVINGKPILEASENMNISLTRAALDELMNVLASAEQQLSALEKEVGA